MKGCTHVKVPLQTPQDTFLFIKHIHCFDDQKTLYFIPCVHCIFFCWVVSYHMAHTRLAWHICPLCRLKLPKGPFLQDHHVWMLERKGLMLQIGWRIMTWDQSIAPIFINTWNYLDEIDNLLGCQVSLCILDFGGESNNHNKVPVNLVILGLQDSISCI